MVILSRKRASLNAKPSVSMPPLNNGWTMGIRSQENAFHLAMILTFEFLKTFSAIPIHMTNICGKFH